MTRPRPSIGPALAGAVDLSALKQRPAAESSASGTGGPGGVEITEANLEAEVLIRSSQIPVVVLLWSPRSDSSVALGQVLADLANADAGKWSLATVNVDTTPRVAQMFGVQAVPTVVALAAGQPISSFQGPQPADQLRRWVDSCSTRPRASSPVRAIRNSPNRSTPRSRRRAQRWTPVTSTPR